MKILFAEDEPVTRARTEALLASWGYQVIPVESGSQAWAVLQQPDAPQLVLTDWQMPEITGQELCRLAREKAPERSLYIIILTASRIAKADLITGLSSGADDYLLKPVDPAELRARLRVGERVLGLQNALESRVRELEEAARQINELRDLLPICCYCKKVRDDQNFWHQVENYITHRTGARISHGICPACFQTQMDQLAAESEAGTDDKGKKV